MPLRVHMLFSQQSKLMDGEGVEDDLTLGIASIIVDEASTVAEQSMPLLLDFKATSLLLVGDQNQLPPCAALLNTARRASQIRGNPPK